MNKKVLTGGLITAVLLLGMFFSPSLFGFQTSLETERTIEMGEMFFKEEGAEKNAPIVLKVAVPYKITFKNAGSLLHRVKFGSGLVVEEGVPFDYVSALFEGVNVQVSGTTPEGDFKIKMDDLDELDLDPGVEIIIEFTLPQNKRGEWEMGCFVIGHYEAGMNTRLIVE